MKNQFIQGNKFQLKKIVFNCFLVTTVILFLTACGTLAPLKEREAALTSIALATQAEAARLAQQDFSKAETEFSTGENAIVREKKSPKNTQAKTNYENAKTNADHALRLALTKLIEETDALIETKTVFAIQNKQNDILAAAEVENENARTELNATQYNQALEATREARRLLAQIEAPPTGTHEDIRESIEKEDVVTLIEETPSYYIVKLRKQKRDSLWRISETLLFDPFRWKDIYELNTNLIKDPDLIYPGQRLLIPKE